MVVDERTVRSDIVSFQKEKLLYGQAIQGKKSNNIVSFCQTDNIRNIFKYTC